MSKRDGDLLRQCLKDWGGLSGAQRSARRSKYIGRKSRELSQQDDLGQVQHSMRVWGIDIENPSHKLFWDAILQAVKDCLNQRGFFHLFDLDRYTPKLDDSPSDALSVERICFQQIQDLLGGTDEMVEVADRLLEEDLNAPFGPPYVCNREGVTTRDGFRHFQRQKLDPLHRFYALKGPRKDMLQKQYLHMGEQSIGSCTALILRSLVIQEACKSAKCAGCGSSSSTLRWNKGCSEATMWRRMICSHCDAVFEFKMVKNLESKIHSSDFPTIDRGTLFGSYKQMRFHYPERKMFLAVIDSACLKFASPSLRQVYVAEIKYAVPLLSPKAFLWKDLNRFCIHTKMTLHSASSWFKIDVPRVVVASPVAFIKDMFDAAVAAIPPRPSAVKKIDPEVEIFLSMTAENLTDHYRGLRRKISRIAVLMKKKDEDLNEEEFQLVASKKRIEKEAARCKKYLL